MTLYGKHFPTLLPALVIAAFGLTACKEEPSIENVYSPTEWRDLLASAGGWTPLPIPDSKYREGSIIRVNEEGIRWIGDLAACGFPMEQFTLSGSIPNVSFSKGKSYGADVLLTYKGISAGPGFNKVGKIVSNIGDQSAETLNLIALRVWQEKPANREAVSPACFEELDRPDRYLITEAFTVADASYTLYDKTGAKLVVTAPVLKSLLDVETSVNFDITAEGKLTVSEPTVFAVRKALRVDHRFEVLGEEANAPETADDRIEEIFLRQPAP